MKYHKVVCYLLFVFIVSGCKKDRDFPVPSSNDRTQAGDSVRKGTLVINEFFASGSTFHNELILQGRPGGGSDWIEVYNTTKDTIVFERGRWYITDSLAFEKRFELPFVTINPNSHLIIWCDGMDTTICQIHANFSLNKNGEEIGLFYKNSKGEMITVDAIVFGEQQSSVSFGRAGDGSLDWKSFPEPTLGDSNE